MTRKKKSLDFAQLEPLDKLTSEEKALHDALQKGKYESLYNTKTVKKYAEIFERSRKQRKVISLRIPTQDYMAIKVKAAHLGLPYQALINSIIHQYVNGQLK